MRLVIAAVGAFALSALPEAASAQDRASENRELIERCTRSSPVCLESFVRTGDGRLLKIVGVEPVPNRPTMVGTTTVFDLGYSTDEEFAAMDIVAKDSASYDAVAAEWRTLYGAE